MSGSATFERDMWVLNEARTLLVIWHVQLGALIAHQGGLRTNARRPMLEIRALYGYLESRARLGAVYSLTRMTNLMLTRLSIPGDT